MDDKAVEWRNSGKERQQGLPLYEDTQRGENDAFRRKVKSIRRAVILAGAFTFLSLWGTFGADIRAVFSETSSAELDETGLWASSGFRPGRLSAAEAEKLFLYVPGT